MDGFTKLGALIGDQSEYAIFPRFKGVWALRLLHLSAEIAHLVHELGLLMNLDRASGDSARVDIEFYYLQLQKSRASTQTREQVELWDKLSVKLKEHTEALLLYRSLSQLPSAHPRHLRNLREYLDDPEGGHSFLRGGVENAIWDTDHESDLTSLCLPGEGREDAITLFIHNTVLPLHQRLFSHQKKQRLYIPDPFSGQRHEFPVDCYPDVTIRSAVNMSSTIMSSLIPALCSLTLFFIRTPVARMGAIIGLNFLFSVILSGVTGAKKSEVFAISAAFSAVLVVFVGNDIMSG